MKTSRYSTIAPSSTPMSLKDHLKNLCAMLDAVSEEQNLCDINAT